MFRIDRSRIDWGVATRCGILMAIPILIATTTDLVSVGVFAAIGCLMVIQSQFIGPPSDQLRRSVWGVGLNAGAIGVGTLVGTLGPLEIPLVAIGLFAIYFVNKIPEAATLPVLVSVLYVIGVGLPGGSVAEAGTRAILLLLGGALGLVGLAIHLAVQRRVRGSTSNLSEQTKSGGPSPGSKPSAGQLPGWEISIAAGVTTAAGLGLAMWLGLLRDYWIMLTVIVVLRASARETLEIGISRMGGTVIGAALAIIFTIGVTQVPLQGVLLIVFAFWAFVFIRANSILFAVSITVFVVLLLDLVYSGGILLAETRVLDTFVGGVLALAAASILWTLSARKNRSTARFGDSESQRA